MPGMELPAFIVLTGIGATMITDLWFLARKALLGTALPSFGLLGRWMAHLAHGRIRHVSIAAAPAVRGELAIGWVAHYATGIGFAALLVAVAGAGWARAPRIGAALLVGVCTVVAPFFIQQPSMGLGVAASRTPSPAQARVQAMVTHAVFGFGLYAAGLAVARSAG
jgi:hypothetical protein